VTNLSMIRGDTRSFALTLTDGAGSPLDLTDVTLTFTAKLRLTDADDEAIIVKTDADGIEISDDPSDGMATLTIDPEDTEVLGYSRSLYWDLQVEDALGAVQTPLSGRLSIRADVTRDRAGS